MKYKIIIIFSSAMQTVFLHMQTKPLKIARLTSIKYYYGTVSDQN
jgi:hypothetical protein